MTFGKRRPGAYTKMIKEDPEERNHRRAQFMIYKLMQQADSRRRPSAMTVRMCRLRVKVGKGFVMLKKNVLFGVSVARVGLNEQWIRRFINFKCFLRCREDRATPPAMLS